MTLVNTWLLLLITMSMTFYCSSSRALGGDPLVPGMFVFGDSLVDNGNNNFLNSIAKSNYIPYGIDFNGVPTGRFCNGKTMVDMLGEMLGLPYIPAYADPTTAGAKILGGVNYASAAAGILEETGQHYALYNVGLRKFLLAGIGPLGCIPNQLATGEAPPGSCVSYANEILEKFNVGLRSVVNQLNSNHTGAIFVYGNTYGAMVDILNNATAYGFYVIDRGCCGLGRNQAQMTCLPLSIPCPNRNQFIFWDAFHPTQAVNTILSQRAFSGPPSDCYPINIQQMAQI
ncbi:GDSL esterase/lipase At1g71250-like isoform X2 [Macadamia integrifolia]|uniref:GDSL esterase/lipase At1g71250-like isoform X2 n=1 Tax=Macadamia integrifolia TaxID=60698 RepID=UPI001C4F753F|nr:GDSL esterase/lipase At1g71250-like isoform X2 [Macadamia integrifolia]